MRIGLKRCTISEEKWRELFSLFPENVYKPVSEEQFGELKFGCSEKNYVYYTVNRCVVQKKRLRLLELDIDYSDDWKQYIVEVNAEQVKPIEDDISPMLAYNTIKAIIGTRYSEEEFDRIVHCYDKFEALHQLHINPPYIKGVIIKYDNCYKYDINGAHADALREMFPRVEDQILKLYNERKIRPNNKKILNYCVGMFKHMGYDGAYWWIVNRTATMLDKAIEECGGQVLYANTDGFVVRNPINLLNVSTNLGDFKLEFQGDMYSYYGDNYSIIQCGKEIKGNAFLSVRNQMDLSQGRVVKYKKVRTDHGYEPIEEETFNVEIKTAAQG